MKAVVCPKYGPPEVLRLAEVTKPTPKENEVLIRVKATTVSVADVRIRGFNVPTAAWLPARLFLGISRPKKPVLGAELAGEVEAVGSKIKRFKQGDPVFAATLTHFGGYAEYVCLPEDSPMALKPTNLSFEQSAAMPIASRTALHFLKKASIREGHKVLVYGASGSVGTYAVQLAHYFGAEVTGVCSTSNLELVKSIGAHKVLDYTQPDFVEKLEQYDIVFLAVDKLPFNICNNILKEEGAYVNVTSPMKNWSQIRASATSKKKIIMGENVPDTPKDLIFLKGLVENGIIKPVIDRTYALDEIVEAHRYVDKGHKKGNVVITVA